MHCSKAFPDLPHATQEGLDRVRDGSFTDFPFERFLSGALESGLIFEGWTLPALHKLSVSLRFNMAKRVARH
jgi:hypothetical protein